MECCQASCCLDSTKISWAGQKLYFTAAHSPLFSKQTAKESEYIESLGLFFPSLLSNTSSFPSQQATSHAKLNKILLLNAGSCLIYQHIFLCQSQNVNWHWYAQLGDRNSRWTPAASAASVVEFLGYTCVRPQLQCSCTITNHSKTVRVQDVADTEQTKLACRLKSCEDIQETEWKC